MASTVQIMQKAGDRKEATLCGEAVARKRQRLKGGEECMVQDGVCLILEELLGAVESRGKAFIRKFVWSDFA